jgi:two-component system phosphate regulon sensor histidine kinase PhoR
MAEGLLLLDQDGRIQLSNKAFNELFGVSNDIRSRTILETLRSHELAQLAGSLGSEDQVLGRELRIERPREQWVQVNGAAIKNGGGKRVGIVLVFHDLTRLRQLEGARQEFVANVSHELRTPLSLIKGYTETLLHGAKDNPQVSEKFLRTIDRNAERLKLLIEDLLTVSELESGRVCLALESVALHPVAEKILNDFRPKAEAKRITLAAQLPELWVHADPGRLEQVLFNLVDNAVKYGRVEGRVTISARAIPGDLVETVVQDDGPGIPPESLDRVFERFYRLDKARSREQGGTGLGLSIVKHIVQSPGGRVWVTSPPGPGAAVCFSLPAGVAEAE